MRWIIGLFVHWAAVTMVFMIAAKAVPEVKVSNALAALGAALIFGVANVLVGIVLGFVLKALLFLPVILTFGIVGLLIPIAVNMVLLMITDIKTDGLQIRGVRALAKMALATSLVGFVVGRIF